MDWHDESDDEMESEDMFFSDDEELMILMSEAADVIFSSSSDDEEEGVRKGGSHPGRRPNLARAWRDVEPRLNRQYFGPNPTNPESYFRRRLRMNKALFNRVFQGVVHADNYFTTRHDAVFDDASLVLAVTDIRCHLTDLICLQTGKLGISVIAKVFAALKMLDYGCSADSLDDNLEMGESTILESVLRFCSAVNKARLCLPTSYFVLLVC